MGGGHLSNKASFISARRLGSFPEEKGGSSLPSRVKTIISQRREEREQDKRKESQVRIIILIVVACQMGALKVVLLYLIVHQAWKITADDEEWKSATATYVKDTNGSIVVEGACGYGDLHKATYGKYSAGLSSMLFNRGSACGACFEVRCVDHILWCLQGSPSVILTATDFCAPNYGLSADYGGWCNFPKEHFEMSEAAFTEIAEKKADIVPVQHRRVKCGRKGGLRFTVSGNFHFYQVLISNVGLDGEVIAVKVKGSKTAWIPMARNWGQNWQSNANLIGQPLSFEVTTSNRKTLTSYNVAPANWQFGQTFEGKQF